ncbi:DNA-3-methyladenine glycosylase family protein [Albidovulum sp.]
MAERIVTGAACLAEGAAWLSRRDPRLAPVLAAAAPLPLRRRPPGFATLAEILVAQQVSTAAAAAIFGRLAAAGLTEAAAVRRASDGALAGCGLSRAKIGHLRALAAADLDHARLAGAGEAEVVAALTALPGFGRWSAEIYLLSALGRADAFPAGDLALREAARRAFGLAARPDEGQLRAMAERWRPWRAVAARALWAYYRVQTGREGTR